jgi:hypothetical protein
MKRRVIACSVVALSATLGAIVRGQEPPPVQSDFTYWYAGLQTAGGGGRGGSIFARVPVEAALVKGAPYFAEVVTESVQTLADGNRIVHKTTGRVYRDSQGRTRREDDREPGKVRTISIVDPVGGFSYSLNPETRTASKTPYRTASGYFAAAPSATATTAPPTGAARGRRPLDAQVEELRRSVEAKVSEVGGGPPPLPPDRRVEFDEKVEKLRARQIEGVTAEGVRTTRTIAAGVVGNEQPLVSVTEEWRSTELQVLVMTRTADPRTGERTYKLLAIQRSEPNASWFDVPGDYTVRDTGVQRKVPQKP